jgi:hypothetical protein
VSNPITDQEDANKTVQFSTIWRGLAVLAFAMLSFITAGLFTWGLWVTMTLQAHEKVLAVLQDRGGGKGITQSVNVGQADKALVKDSAKIWLTTKDVATREGISERTVINYIEQGMIDPLPRKNGKAWEIAENFRIVPPDTEECRNLAAQQGEEDGP